MLSVQITIPPVAVNPFERKFIRQSERMSARQQLAQPPTGSTPMSWQPLRTIVKGLPPAQAQAEIQKYINGLLSAAETEREKAIIANLQAGWEAAIGGDKQTIVAVKLTQAEIDASVKMVEEAISYAWGDKSRMPWPPPARRGLFTRPVAQYLVGLGLFGAVAGLVWWQQRR